MHYTFRRENDMFHGSVVEREVVDEWDLLNTPDGMVYSAGPIRGDNGSHCVLWTKDSFEGGSLRQYQDFDPRTHPC